MDDLRKQWRREETVKGVVIFLLTGITLSISTLLIVHTFHLLGFGCTWRP